MGYEEDYTPDKIVIGDRIFDVRIEDNHWVFDNRLKISDELLFAEILMELSDRAYAQDSIKNIDIAKLKVLEGIVLDTVLYKPLEEIGRWKMIEDQ